MFKKALKLGAAAAVAVTGAAATAHAQSAGASAASSGGVTDVVITARKRSENLQKVPVAVTAATGKQLEQQGIRQTTDLSKIVPSLTVATSASQNSAAVFTLRGQAAGDILLTVSQPVGVYEDTVNVPHPVGLQGSFFDIQRVEVLKGPQGTLYGRNTTGGAVNIITRGADYNGIHGYVYGEGGNFADWKAAGAVNLPIIQDVLSARVAYQHWNRDGYGQSLVTGEKLGGDHDDDIARLSLRFDPTSNVSSISKVEYVHLNQNGYLNKFAAVPNGSTAANNEALAEQGALSQPLVGIAPYVNTGGFYNNYAEANVFDKVTAWHAVEDLTWNLSDDLKLRSITGYHSVRDEQSLDLDATPFNILEVNTPLLFFPQNPAPGQPDSEYESYTQEFDLSGHSFGRLDWLVGAFGSTERGDGAEPASLDELTAALPPNGAGPGVLAYQSQSSKEKTDTWAIYTQNDIHLSDRVSVTLGARYTSEREKDAAQQYLFSGPIAAGLGAPIPASTPFICLADASIQASPSACPIISSSEKSSGISYLASFNFQINPNTLLYVKTARGFRGGALQFRAPALAGVKPEVATDYEIGLKSDLFNHKLRTNLAAYQTNYDNKQETVIQVINGTANTVLQNAATARIDGFEAEVFAAPVTGLSMYGTLSYVNAKYLSFPDALTTTGVLIDASGEAFAIPKWQYSVGSRYEHDLGPGKLGGQLDWSWRDKTPVTARTDLSAFYPADLLDGANDSVGLLNGRLDYTLPDHQVTVALFATNLLDKKWYTASLLSPQLGVGTIAPQEPRMWGVSIRKAFGNE